MRNHKDSIRGFHLTNKAWYYSAVARDHEVEIMFGFYHPEGGTTGEMAMRWEMLGGRSVPQLQVYDDAWDALAKFPDLIQKMGEMDNQNSTPDQFEKILLSCGFKDLTAYKQGD